jgi:hypothetical protein
VTALLVALFVVAGAAAVCGLIMAAVWLVEALQRTEDDRVD